VFNLPSLILHCVQKVVQLGHCLGLAAGSIGKTEKPLTR
jgi:hypothetical protein